MSGSYEQRAAARKAADLMVMDLMSVSGTLEEVATVWRRAKLFGQNPPAASPHDLQEAARSLADTVLEVPDADCDQIPALAFRAVAELAALENSAALAAAVMGDRHPGDAGMWAAIQDILRQARKQLWNLITHLTGIEETPLTEDGTAGRDAPVTGGSPSQPPAAAAEKARQALVMQRTAIDALPEAELRRLLVLIGGTDPAALQRAAVTYMELFSGVTWMKASVAALKPVAVNVPCDS